MRPIRLTEAATPIPIPARVGVLSDEDVLEEGEGRAVGVAVWSGEGPRENVVEAETELDVELAPASPVAASAPSLLILLLLLALGALVALGAATVLDGVGLLCVMTGRS